MLIFWDTAPSINRTELKKWGPPLPAVREPEQLFNESNKSDVHYNEKRFAREVVLKGILDSAGVDEMPFVANIADKLSSGVIFMRYPTMCSLLETTNSMIFNLLGFKGQKQVVATAEKLQKGDWNDESRKLQLRRK